MEKLAQDTYGKIPARGEAPAALPPAGAASPTPTAWSPLSDPKVDQPSAQRVYLVPSYRTGAEDAAALEVLGHHLGGGQTSLLYRTLVLEQKIAVAAGAYYMGTSFDDTRFYIWAIPSEDTSLEVLDAAVEEVIAQRRRARSAEAEDLARAKTRLIADAVYAQDNQATLARWYGAALTTGLTADDVAQWPDKIDAVSAEAVRDAAATWLTKRRSVTGFLLPEEAA